MAGRPHCFGLRRGLRFGAPQQPQGVLPAASAAAGADGCGEALGVGRQAQALHPGHWWVMIWGGVP